MLDPVARAHSVAMEMKQARIKQLMQQDLPATPKNINVVSGGTHGGGYLLKLQKSEIFENL